MANAGRYEFAPEVRAAYEALNVPMAVYQFINDKCVTLLVTDGLCRLLGAGRAELTYQFDTDMFGSLHPDDVERLATLGLHYAISGTNYDTVIRVRRPDGNGYMRIHTTARPAIMDDGTRIDFFTYADVTDIDMGITRSIETSTEPKGRFLDESVSAVAVISDKHNILLYCNNAMKVLLPPQKTFDSPITFEEYFYPDIPCGIPELSRIPDDGFYTVSEPRTGRRLGVHVIGCGWAGEPCRALYFYELKEDSNTAPEAGADARAALAGADIATLRKAFDTVIFSGARSDCPLSDPAYRGFCAWNIETGALAACSGENCLAARLGNGLKYDDYILAVADCLDDMKSELAANWNSARLSHGCETEGYTRAMTLSLRIDGTLVPLRVGAVLMRSPDDRCLYVRFSEENITNRIIDDRVLMNAISGEFELVAYLDFRADRCRVFYGRTSNETEKDITARLGEYCQILAKMIGQDVISPEDFLSRLEAECAAGRQSVRILETSGDEFKSVRILQADAAEKQFYLTRIDVTDTVRRERRREQELAAAKDKAEKAGTSVQQFLSSVSHDLRTPLNGIIGFTDLALRADDPVRKQDYLGKIASSGSLMLDLVNDVLDTSKIESGQMELQMQAVDSVRLFEGIIESVGLLADKKNIAFHHIMAPDYPAVILADRLKLQQLTLNLLSNAVKYTPNGGEIWFEICPLSEPVFGCNTRVTIRDTGIGMSEEYQARMFEPFSQERRQQYAGVQGTGLGLFIVHKIVELMNGRIEVNSAVDRGTTFDVYLPLEATDSARNGTVLHHAEPDIAGARILLAEDNDLNAEIAAAILIERGKADVERAITGADALDIFVRSAPGYFDAILMDIRMPVMDGFAATRAIRAADHADAKTIPIIAMTADAFAEDVSACLEAGMNGHIAKPIDPGKLLSVLNVYIGAD